VLCLVKAIGVSLDSVLTYDDVNVGGGGNRRLEEERVRYGGRREERERADRIRRESIEKKKKKNRKLCRMSPAGDEICKIPIKELPPPYTATLRPWQLELQTHSRFGAVTG
jgi:hypothetical protein